MTKYDVIILGAGAAGLMCALRASQRGRNVLLLDHGNQVGAKILISGGGRCNFTNRNISADNFLSSNPHFCLSALRGFTQNDFISMVEKHKILYHEKTLGQLFCDVSARDIVAMLLNECSLGNVDIRVNQHIADVSKSDHFVVKTQSDIFEGLALVLATGGLSIPKMGATGLSYQLAEQFGLAVTETRPALVPLIFDGQELEFMRSLAGISLDVIASSHKRSFRESMIFTHRGLSGPALLQISSFWKDTQEVSLNLLPDMRIEEFLIERKQSRPKAELKTILGELFPNRLAQEIVSVYFSSEPMGNFSHQTLREIALHLSAWKLKPSGSEGYAKAEVTLGGIDTKGLSSKTMQSNKMPGLFVIGEAVDVTGWLGGYNFQWAWSSGWAAGTAV